MKSFRPLLFTEDAKRPKNDQGFSPFFSTSKVVRFGIPEMDTKIFPGGIPQPCLIAISGTYPHLEPATTWQPLCYAFAMEGCRSGAFDKDSYECVHRVLYLSLNSVDKFHRAIQRMSHESMNHDSGQNEKGIQDLKIAWRYKSQHTKSIAEPLLTENDKELVKMINWIDLSQQYSSQTLSLEWIFDTIEKFLLSRKELHTRIVLENILSPIICGDIMIFISKLRQIVASSPGSSALIFNSSLFLSSIEQSMLLHQSDAHFSIRKGSILELSKPILVPTSMSAWLPVTSHVQWKLKIDRHKKQLIVEPCTLSAFDEDEATKEEIFRGSKSSCSRAFHEF